MSPGMLAAWIAAGVAIVGLSLWCWYQHTVIADLYKDLANLGGQHLPGRGAGGRFVKTEPDPPKSDPPL
jgi:hypothetical protein